MGLIASWHVSCDGEIWGTPREACHLEAGEMERRSWSTKARAAQNARALGWAQVDEHGQRRTPPSPGAYYQVDGYRYWLCPSCLQRVADATREDA